MDIIQKVRRRRHFLLVIACLLLVALEIKVRFSFYKPSTLSNVDVAICIFSNLSPSSIQTRKAIRKTWLKILESVSHEHSFTFSYHFVVGYSPCYLNIETQGRLSGNSPGCSAEDKEMDFSLEREQVYFRDILRVFMIDTPGNSSSKIQCAIKSLSSVKYRFLLKIDEDIFLNPSQFLDSLKSLATSKTFIVASSKQKNCCDYFIVSSDVAESLSVLNSRPSFENSPSSLLDALTIEPKQDLNIFLKTSDCPSIFTAIRLPNYKSFFRMYRGWLENDDFCEFISLPS